MIRFAPPHRAAAPAATLAGSGGRMPIWESGRFGAQHAGATVGLRAPRGRSGSERAAEDPPGARE
jgi:hypothetical protein